MSVRKVSIGGSTAASRGEPTPKRLSPTNNDEYTAAVAVMNDATMTQACSLLLSERDFQSNQEEDASDHSQLLDIFAKCEAACKVIQQRAPAVPMPTLQQSRGPAPAARAQAKALKPKVKTMLPPRARTLLPSSRPAMKTGPLPPASMSQPPVRKLQRETSDSSFASVGSSGSARSAKKARLSPPTLEAPAVAAGKVQAPPPAAMSFLIALNAQQQQDKQQTKEKPASTRESPPPTASTRRQPARNKSPPPAAAGTRKQPPRNGTSDADGDRKTPPPDAPPAPGTRQQPRRSARHD